MAFKLTPEGLRDEGIRFEFNAGGKTALWLADQLERIAQLEAALQRIAAQELDTWQRKVAREALEAKDGD